MDIYTVNVFILLIVFGIVSECSLRKADQATDIEDFIEKRCRSNEPETTFENELREIDKYQEDISNMGKLIPSEKEKFCSEFVQLSITISLHNFTEALTECFPKEEQYLPKFTNEIYKEYFIYFVLLMENLLTTFSVVKLTFVQKTSEKQTLRDVNLD